MNKMVLKSDMLRRIVFMYGEDSDEAKLMLHIVTHSYNMKFIRKMYNKLAKY